MLNKVMLIGNLGKDPEIRATPNGTKVATITVATTERFTSNGQKQEKTEWHTVIFWGKLADVVGTYCQKGTTIYCDGRIETRNWEKDGVKHYKTEIVANELKIIKGFRDNGGSGSAPVDMPQGSQEEDLPF